MTRRRGTVLILDGDGRATHVASWDEPLDEVLWIDPPPQQASEPAGRSIALGRIEVPAGEARASYALAVDPGQR